jgi:hypothetical protein
MVNLFNGGEPMKKIFSILAAAASVAGVASVAGAAETATATISQVANLGGSPTVFQYALTLNDTGTTTAGTFWYAWVPGQDYMDVLPTSITSPVGWQEIVTGSGNSSDGYAIQWSATTSAADLAAGSSLTGFGFDSSDSITQLTSGLSVSHPTVKVGTSFIYPGEPEAGPGDEFVVTAAVPEPRGWQILGAAAVGMLSLRSRRKVAVA